jgi:hypothetical protein
MISYDAQRSKSIQCQLFSNWASKSLEELKLDAESGNAESQFLLGEHFTRLENNVEAARLYRLAAAQSHAGAQYRLGRCYDNAVGMKVDYVEAVKWYSKAAEQGHAQAQYDLGYCYKNGKGIARSEIEALKWFHKAAGQGNRLAEEMFEKARQEAQFKELQKAAAAGDVNAQFELGNAYYCGSGVDKDFWKALKLWQKVAEQGHVEAQSWLGHIYATHDYVRDDKKATKWNRMAAEQKKKNVRNLS